MLDRAAKILRDDVRPVIHSDRGGHYLWPGWLSRIDKYGLKQSMSQKACPKTTKPVRDFSEELRMKCSITGLGMESA
jgi:putative transposase